ncbi:zinc finger protein 239-like isoform X4 [Periplaneta americana]|uniref:zinc finger protein 239-like isoform X4 n=1 Tax=Periplaneta americana TaxID=6978 RepID=UPI0037E9C6B7
MYAIKTEPEVDPLAVQPCDDALKEDTFSSPAGSNFLDRHVTGIKMECVDDMHDLKSEMIFEETSVPNDFPIVKNEAEVESSDMIQVKEEVKLEITTEEDEVVTQSHNNGVPSFCCSVVKDNRHGDKMYKCDVCGKCFAHLKTLKNHARIHTGDKPFSCDVCGKNFSQRVNLKRHALLHTGDKPFNCYVCGKGFTSSQNLKTHERTHTGEKPFKCDVCGKHFSCSQNMKTHQRTHTGEKPFKCDICGKLFPFSQYLKTHERIHTGEKPFKCNVCGKTYSQLSNFRKHARCRRGHSSGRS